PAAGSRPEGAGRGRARRAGGGWRLGGGARGGGRGGRGAGGAFYPPTVLVAVEPGMPAFDEETFGPVAAVIRARDEGDAIRIANASVYGLGAAVWTEDTKRGQRVARDSEAGSVFVNRRARYDPRP